MQADEQYFHLRGLRSLGGIPGHASERGNNLESHCVSEFELLVLVGKRGGEGVLEGEGEWGGLNLESC